MPDQRSLTEQLAELIPVANKMGLYDAADFLKRHVEATSKLRVDDATIRILSMPEGATGAAVAKLLWNVNPRATLKDCIEAVRRLQAGERVEWNADVSKLLVLGRAGVSFEPLEAES